LFLCHSRFYCPGKGINTINVRINDYIRLVCQKPGRLIDWHDSLTVPNTEMHGVAYMTENEAQFGQCIADGEYFLNYIQLLFNSANIVLSFVTNLMAVFSK